MVFWLHVYQVSLMEKINGAQLWLGIVHQIIHTAFHEENKLQ